MLRWSALIAVTLAVTIPAAPLLAQPAGKPAAPIDPKKVAKEYVDAGVAAQTAGDYDTALTFFGKAYELVPHPVLLFNMAQANRLAGRLDVALALYRQYVAAEPKGAQVKTAREFITAITVQLEAAAARAAEAAKRAQDEAAAAAAATAAREAEAAAAAQVAADAAAAEQARVAAAAAAEAARRRDEEARGRRGRGTRIAGLVTAGVGVASLGVGVFYGLRARTLSDQLSTPGTVYDPDDDAAGKAAETRMIIATAAGGALLIGGVVIHLIGRKQDRAAEAPRAALVPVIVRGGGAIVAEGRW